MLLYNRNLWSPSLIKPILYVKNEVALFYGWVLNILDSWSWRLYFFVHLRCQQVCLSWVIVIGMSVDVGDCYLWRTFGDLSKVIATQEICAQVDSFLYAILFVFELMRSGILKEQDVISSKFWYYTSCAFAKNFC